MDYVTIVELGTVVVGVVLSVSLFMYKVNQDHKMMQESLKEIVNRCIISNDKCMATIDKVTERLLPK